MSNNKEDGCKPQLFPEFLFADPPLSPDLPMDKLSSYGAFDFVSQGSHVYGQIMWPELTFDTPRPCVIMFHGYPGTARHDDMLHALVRMGCVAVTPHFRGAWGSQGKYTITNCIEDALGIAEYVRGGEFSSKYNIDPDRIYIMGHSMGGNTCIHAANDLPWVRGIILLAPFDPTYYVRVGRQDEQSFVLQDGYPLNYDGVEAMCKNIEDNFEALIFDKDLEKMAETGRDVLCILGDADYYAPPYDMVTPIWDRICTEEHPWIRPYVMLHTDHDLFGQRVTATEAIAEFICETV